jgi:transcription initiation factor TFIIIB Brf1 subunit/transcription initiation factor TFIIB
MTELPSTDDTPHRWRSFSTSAVADDADTASASDPSEVSSTKEDNQQQLDRHPDSQSGDIRTLTNGRTTPTRHDRGLGSTLTGGQHNESVDDLEAGGITPRRATIQHHDDPHVGRTGPPEYLIREVHRIVSQLEFPDQVRTRACELCHAMSAEPLRGFAFEAWAGAAVYAAAREQDIYRPLRTVAIHVKSTADSTNTTGEAPDSVRQLRSCYVRLQKTLDLEIAPAHPSDELHRLQTAIDEPVTGPVLDTATECITDYMDAGHTGAPGGIAAGALLVALEEDAVITESAVPSYRERLSEVGDVAARTVKRHYDSMRRTDTPTAAGETETRAPA